MLKKREVKLRIENTKSNCVKCFLDTKSKAVFNTLLTAKQVFAMLFCRPV